MKSSRGFKFLLSATLVFTLGCKLLLRPAASGEGAMSPQSQLAEFLTRQHFSVSVVEHPADGQPSVVASTGVCRISAFRSPAMGSDRDLVRRLALPTDEVFVVYRGKIYNEQPTWLTVSDFLWARALRELGISSTERAVYAIISPKNCSVSRLPWEEFTARAATAPV